MKSHILLTVTQSVINYEKQVPHDSRQIAIQGGSALAVKKLNAVHKKKPANIVINGKINLVVRSTRSIWALHQAKGKQAKDFNNLYKKLARRPGVCAKFPCSISFPVGD